MTTEYEKNDTGGQLNSNHVHTYFSQINPMAQRIAKTISDEKSTYGMLWYTLNRKDQDDILNETLIKPELTLHYIDSLALKRSLSSSSLDNAIKDKSMRQLSIEKKDAKELGNYFSTANQQYYGFDGRSLSSFAMQRVAQKLLKDDALADAGYRDEHSAPFSYRTRSQINFHLDNNNNDDDDNLNEEKKLIMQISEATAPCKITATSQISAVKKPKRLAPIKPAENITKNINVPEAAKKPDLLAANFAMTISSTTSYSPVQHEDEESHSLIPRQMHDQQEDKLKNNARSITTDEDDDPEYYDEGNHEEMEEVKLLDAHVSLKRGFEFLNNW